MFDAQLSSRSEQLQRERSLSRWENDGGAGPDSSEVKLKRLEQRLPSRKMGDAEMLALRIRIIALENLVIALLVEASDREIELAEEAAAFISPRAGSRQHPLTICAANHMIDLVQRAARFRSHHAAERCAQAERPGEQETQ
jgi:hypothetical protein